MGLRTDESGNIGAVLLDTLLIIIIAAAWFATTPVIDGFGTTAEQQVDELDNFENDTAAQDTFDGMDWALMLWPWPIIVIIVIHAIANAGTRSYVTGRG